MQQRAMIAMALAAQPALLVADEPTTALDVTIQVQILRLLRDLQRTLNLSVLLISHDLMVVERIAHRVGVMAAGKLVELGPVAQVLHQPGHPHTQQLLRYRSMIRLDRSRSTNG
jgi:ABC-type dipeptide/oligopeptide/nickel transport system ATPase component